MVWNKIGRYVATSAGITVALVASSAFAQGIETLTFTDSVLVNTDGDTSQDLANDVIDRNHQAATDGNGIWVVVWERRIGLSGASQDIYIARSSDDAQTWTAPTLLHVNDGRIDTDPHIETDGNGTWIIAFSSHISDVSNFRDVLFCRSTDNGASFSAAQELNILPPNGFNNDFNSYPRLATDRNGIWMAVWSMDGRAFSGIAGIDIEIFGALSPNNGISWGNPFPVNVDALTDVRADGVPDVATDRAGNWIAVWERAGDIDPIGADKDIYYAVSSNNGGTWSFMTTLNSNADSDEGSGTLDQDQVPRIESNGRQQWIAVWRRLGGVTDDSEHAYAVLNGSGGAWSGASTFQPSGEAFDTDSLPDIVADRFGNWIATWQQTTGTFDSTLSSLALAISRDGGTTWAPRQSIPETERMGNLNAVAGNPVPATSNSGDAFVFWQARDEADVSSPIDTDIRVAKAFLSGSISGRITAGGVGVSCGFIAASATDPTFEKAVATDANGFYLMEGLPAGTYTVTTGGPGLTAVRANVVVTAGESASRDVTLLSQSEGETISGVVSDIDTGYGLAGARVTASIGATQVAETFTCATGAYELTGLLKGVTQVDLDFSQPGYVPQSQSVDLGPADDLVADANMQKAIGFPGTLSGMVSSEPGKQMGIPGARIEATGFTGITTFANEAGIYSIDALPEGQYEVRASAEGFMAETKSVGVPLSDVAILQFSLSPTDGTDLNGDFVTNSIDIQLVINGVLGIDIGSVNANVNGDGAINSIDIQLVINAVLGL